MRTLLLPLIFVMALGAGLPSFVQAAGLPLDKSQAVLEPQANKPVPTSQPATAPGGIQAAQNAGSPATPSAQGGIQTAQNAAQAADQGTGGFVPLTNLPGINEAGNAATLPTFFNSLYKLCIGAAAVIAILQIMRAGAYFMFNKGSVAQNEQAKSLISNSVLGLLLVLSPAIVFGIINPSILNLRLNLSGLEPDGLNNFNNSDLTVNNQQQCSAYIGAREVCSTGDNNTANTCNPNASCNAASGEVKVANQCCNLIHSGAVCCAKLSQTQYVLAYTYTRQNTNGTTCRVTPPPTYYAQLGAGNAGDANLNGGAGCNPDAPRGAVGTQPGFNVFAACVQVNGPYTIPDQYKDTCGTPAARTAISPVSVRVPASFSGQLTVSSVWQASDAAIFNDFSRACTTAQMRVHYTISANATPCLPGAPESCKLANLTCQ